MEKQRIDDDEVNIFNYWKVIIKRRWLLIGVFLISIATTSVVNLLMPKIYRGEYIIKMATADFNDVLERINVDDKEKMREILPKTYLLLYELKVTTIPDPVLYKLNIIIDVKKTSDISLIATELLEYINNFPYYKRSVEQRKKLLQKQLEELSIAIANSDAILKTYNTLLQSAKLVPLGFNPIELYDGILELKTKKVILEQSLKNHIGMEIITQDIFSNPVKPRIKMNIALSALIGLLAGMFLVFFAEFAEKITTPPGNEPEQ